MTSPLGGIVPIGVGAVGSTTAIGGGPPPLRTGEGGDGFAATLAAVFDQLQAKQAATSDLAVQAATGDLRDVHDYIFDAFGQNEALAKLRGNTVVPEEANIVGMLTEASSGIFLWAQLATKFLLQELTGNDNFTALQNRAEVLPADLDELLSHILSNFEPGDLEQACKISELVEAHGYPPLLGLSFALSSDEKSSIAAPRAPLKQSDMAARYDAMRQMLTYKCRNLFDVDPK